MSRRGRRNNSARRMGASFAGALSLSRFSWANDQPVLVSRSNAANRLFRISLMAKYIFWNIIPCWFTRDGCTCPCRSQIGHCQATARFRWKSSRDATLEAEQDSTPDAIKGPEKKEGWITFPRNHFESPRNWSSLPCQKPKTISPIACLDRYFIKLETNEFRTGGKRPSWISTFCKVRLVSKSR